MSVNSSSNHFIWLIYGIIFISMMMNGFAPVWGAEQQACNSSSESCRALMQWAKDEKLNLNTSYLKGYVTDTGKMLASPLQWGSRDWLAAALVVSVTAGLYAYDQDIKDWFQKKRNGTTDDIGKLVNPLGNPLYTVPAAGLLYLYGEMQESVKAKRIGLLGAESIILSSVFNAAIKFASQRHRPDSGDPYNRWDGPRFSTDNLSFPSEHASAAFAFARVVASENDSPYVTSVAYGIATLVALSRLNGNDHWSSDAFFGAALGYFTAGAVLRYHKDNKNVFSVLPDFGGDRYGLQISYAF